MPVRFELTDQLFIKNSTKNEVTITEESGLVFLNVKVQMKAGAPGNETSPADILATQENFRETYPVGQPQNLLAVREAGTVEVRRMRVDTPFDGTSSLRLTLTIVPKVPHTGG